MRSKTETYDDHFYESTKQYFKDGLPAFRNFILNDLKAKSIADFGCGEGDWLEVLETHIYVFGCDIGPKDENVKIKNFQRFDFTKQTANELETDVCDVCMSLEVMEHIENKFENNFLDCLLYPKSKYVILSCGAGKGIYNAKEFRINKLGEKVLGGKSWLPQFGTHHVNCQPKEAVIEKMKSRGYEVNEELTNKFTNLKTYGRRGEKWAFASFYRKNVVIYERLSDSNTKL